MTALRSEGPPRLALRVVARGIDVVVLAALGVGLGKLIGFGFDWLVLTALFVLVYFAGLDALFGATPGKRLTGLTVVGPDGGRPTLRQALVRESFTVLGAIPLAGPLLAMAAWIWIVATIRTSPVGQGKHDTLAGGTRVVFAARSAGATANERATGSASSVSGP